MAKESNVWNKVMSTALKMPGVAVDREKFLRGELRKYYNDEQKVKQEIIKDINSKSGYYSSASNTLYINENVKFNLVNNPKVNENDMNGDYYIYDYYFTKLSKDLRKEREE